MKINTSSFHYRWGAFFYHWSIWRDVKRPLTICSYFWKWLVFAPFMSVLSGYMFALVGIVVGGIGLVVLLGPLVLAILIIVKAGFTPVAAAFATIFFLGQLLIWWIIWRKYKKEKTLFPKTHTGAVIAEAFRAGKQKVCPMVTYKTGYRSPDTT